MCVIRLVVTGYLDPLFIHRHATNILKWQNAYGTMTRDVGRGLSYGCFNAAAVTVASKGVGCVAASALTHKMVHFFFFFSLFFTC
jgi:hypothetical protein